MSATNRKRATLLALVALLVLIAGSLVGFRIAAAVLKGKVVEALGAGSEVTNIEVGWAGVLVEGLRIKGPPGWPSADALRAEGVTVAPSLWSLLSGRIRVRSITVVKPYLSVWRVRDGTLRVLPGLLTGSATGQASGGPPARAVTISRVTLREGVLDLFDASVGPPAARVRLEQIEAAVRNVVAPTLTGRSEFELTGLVKGVQRDGRASVSGWSEPTSKDSSVKLRLRSIDLVALQPYLTRAAGTQVRRGALDLDLDAEVRGTRLRAPGRVVISDLEFPPSREAADTFMGLPRAAVVSLLQSRQNTIEVKFTIEGDLNNPRFSLSEAVASYFASALAENLGATARGTVAGARGLGLKGADAAGEAAKGVGGTLQRLFGGQKKQ